MGDTPAVILVRPQLADNIGMVARAMANFGLERAAPRRPARRLAQREGAHRRLRRQLHRRCGARPIPRSRTALAGLHWVCATTARQRDLAKPVLTPEQAVAEMRRRIGEGQRCGILFGPERNGLETEEVANADAAVMAPVNPNFASLNLAQAVLLLSYEWMKQADAGTLGRVTTYEAPAAAGPADPRLAAGDAGGADRPLRAHRSASSTASGFFTAPEKRPSVVQNLRAMFTRMGATEQEIRTLRGIVKALAGGKRPRRESP